MILAPFITYFIHNTSKGGTARWRFNFMANQEEELTANSCNLAAQQIALSVRK
jgi:hypothetical protein